jgi:hypothetical protein
MAKGELDRKGPRAPRRPGTGAGEGQGQGQGEAGGAVVHPWGRGRVVVAVVAVVARWDDGAMVGEKGMKGQGRKPRRRGHGAIAAPTSAFAEHPE